MYLLAILSAFLLVGSATFLIRRMARRKQWLAIPSEDRWHQTPTPKFGGVALYFGISISLLFCVFPGETFVPAASTEAIVSGGGHSIRFILWAGMTVLFVLGLIDDLRRIGPHAKLIGQILVAAAAVFLGLRLQWFHSLTLDSVITLLWIVGITNAFNLIDNMDGLCAGIAVIAALFFGILLYGGHPEGACVALIVAGGASAFLLFNFHPASIFMGDCGSMPLGFALSLLPIVYSTQVAQTSVNAVAVPIMILLAPIFDTILVTVVRILSGRRATVGGKDHSSHRLVLMGMSETGAVLLLYGLGVVAGLSALFVNRSDFLTSPAVIVPLAVMVVLAGVYLSKIRVYPEREFALLRGKSFSRLLLEMTYRRQIVLILLDFGLVAFSYYLAYRIRFDSSEFAFFFNGFLNSLPAIIACKLLVFHVLGVYRPMLGRTSPADIRRCIAASFISTLTSISAVTYLYRFQHFSKGVFLIDFLLTTGFLLAVRASYRFFMDAVRHGAVGGDPVLIFSAGTDAGVMVDELLNRPDLNMKPIGFIDDDPLKKGKTLLGYPVLGNSRELSSLLIRRPFRGILISAAIDDQTVVNEMKTFCRRNGLFLKRFSIRLEDVGGGSD